MDRATKNDRLIRFSIFELDRNSGELFKQGRKVKLQGQPFELLLALLERPGEVLTREELRQKIWPSDTAGDFDHGLNRAVNKVREALGDSAETPRFIETLPRRGYRFIGSIQQENDTTRPPAEAISPPAASQAPPQPAREQKAKPRRRSWTVVAIAGGRLPRLWPSGWRFTGRQRKGSWKCSSLPQIRLTTPSGTLSFLPTANTWHMEILRALRFDCSVRRNAPVPEAAGGGRRRSMVSSRMVSGRNASSC